MRIAMTALALALVAGSSAQAADVVLASSAFGVNSGSNSDYIRAYAGGSNYRTYTNTAGDLNPYGFNTSMSMFRTFTAADFTAAQSAPVANLLGTPLPGSWNNAGNVAGSFTGTDSARLNSSLAQWIHNSTDENNAGSSRGTGQSVLFAVPFNATTNRVDITLSFLTDNGFGNSNGGNGRATPTGYANDGVFMNGTSLGYSSPGGSGQPAQFGNITTLTFTNVSTTIGQNWLYLYQFNWGGPGGSAFTAEINMVPTPVGAGLSAAGMLLLAARRRRA